ncbi:N-acetylmuramoyl-L-alanine amidase [Pararhodospirillum photometricum]|uniref:N-acetylmuramoyl-L-alanine amidase n=1 Tax=Pararhodospirillum photometricum TaxID=1084 RepID=UPI00030CA7F1|nr:N-acetylmuramoyl-L-alanine amidase [Pararhodospirillum photometricum]
MKTALGLALMLALAGAPSAEACVLGVDVGHTAARPGATSARGAPEFLFNQALGRTITAALRQDGRFGVVLINDDGTIGGLPQRPAAARAAGATVFLSIHHDSVQPHYLEPWTVQGRVAQHSERFSGFSVFISQSNSAPEASERWARALGQALRQQGFRPSLHHAEPIDGENRPLLDPALGLYRYDGLAVLRTAAMPAALLEAGIIVNRDDELLLMQPQTRARLAQAVVDALATVCR